MGVLKSLSPIAMLAGGGGGGSEKSTLIKENPTPVVQSNKELSDEEYRAVTGRKRIQSTLLPNQSNTLGG